MLKAKYSGGWYRVTISNSPCERVNGARESQRSAFLPELQTPVDRIDGATPIPKYQWNSKSPYDPLA
jgi:hypothetical protein